jgi:RNA polymerase sigma-70 factor, ECF subfamily
VFSTGSARSKNLQSGNPSSAAVPDFEAPVCDDLTGAYRIRPSLPPEEGLKVLSDSWREMQGQENEPQEYPDLRGFLWSQLVARLQAGDGKAMEELYSMFSNGVRYYLARQLGRDDIEDRLHDSFLVVVEAIQSGELRDPRFIRTVVKRTVSSSISRQMTARRRNIDDERTANVSDPAATPERALLFRQQAAIVREVLSELSGRDREILSRFYVQEQSALQICEEMDLTVTQFRLLKSRAKNRFGELGRKRVQKSGLSQVLLRFSGR